MVARESSSAAVLINDAGILQYPVDLVPSSDLNNLKISFTCETFFGLYVNDTFMTPVLWRYVFKTIVVFQRYILNIITEITIEFFNYDIRVITDRAIDVQHSTFVIILRYITL